MTEMINNIINQIKKNVASLDEISLGSCYAHHNFTSDSLGKLTVNCAYNNLEDLTFDNDIILRRLEIDPNISKNKPAYITWSFRVLVDNEYQDKACQLLQMIATNIASIISINLSDLRHYTITKNLTEYCLTLSTHNYPMIIKNKVFYNEIKDHDDSLSYDSTEYLMTRDLPSATANKQLKVKLTNEFNHTDLTIPYIIGINDNYLPTNKHYFDNVVFVNEKHLTRTQLENRIKHYIKTRFSYYKTNQKKNTYEIEIVPPITLAMDPNELPVVPGFLRSSITKDELNKHKELITYLSQFV